MFKIKRTSNRTLNNKEILVETINNIPECPPLPERVFKRPPSAKLTRHKVSAKDPQEFQSNSSKSIEICREVRQVEARLTERSNIEHEIKMICQNTLREKCRRVGEGKDTMIGKVLEKAALAVREELEKDDWKQLVEMIEGEADKMIKAKQCKNKYESSLTKIQNMLDERLNKLSTLR